jgi:oxalate decarboxylase
VNQLDFPILSGMALSLLELNPKGMREPHWHPNASELGYCIEGRAVMTLLGPGGQHETFLIEPGCLSYVPMGTLHHIENLGPGPLKMLLCFDNESPEDLDISAAIGSMPEAVLSKTFQLDQQFFLGLHADVKSVFISEMAKHDAVSDSWKMNRYKFDIEAEQPQVETRGGWVKMSNSSLMPTLNGLALYSLKLEKDGAREPHWHPNAHELNYLISGKARITLLSPNGNVDMFDMKAGDMSFLPRGYFHSIENIGSEAARFAVYFNHSNPSDIGISACLGAYPNDVFASLFKLPVGYFDKLPKFQSDLFVVSGGG